MMEDDTKAPERSARETIGQLCGQLTMCWQPIPEGVFDSTKAAALVDEIFDYFHMSAGINITRYRDVMAALTAAKARIAELERDIANNLVVWKTQFAQELAKERQAHEEMKGDIKGMACVVIDLAAQLQAAQAERDALRLRVEQLEADLNKVIECTII